MKIFLVGLLGFLVIIILNFEATVVRSAQVGLVLIAQSVKIEQSFEVASSNSPDRKQNDCLLLTLGKFQKALRIVAETNNKGNALKSDDFINIASEKIGCAEEAAVSKSKLSRSQIFTLDNLLTKLAFSYKQTIKDPEPKKWLIIFQNPAESRATGGLLGFYAIADVGNDEIIIADFKPNDDLPTFYPTNISHPEDYKNLYGESASSIWLNDNISPHFPYAADVWIDKFSRYLGYEIEGVITIDPIVVARYMKKKNVSFMVNNEKISGRNFVDMTLYEAYIRFDERDNERIEFLSEITKSLFENISFNDLISPSTFLLLNTARDEGRVQIYAKDPNLRKALFNLKLFRDLSDNQEAVFITFNNLGENKLDYFIKTELLSCTDRENPRISQHLISIKSEVEPDRYLPGYMNRRGDIVLGEQINNSNRLLVGIYGSNASKINDLRYQSDNSVITTFQKSIEGTELNRPVTLVPIEVPAGNKAINLRFEIEHDQDFSQDMKITPLKNPHLVKSKAQCT
jgi:hypothetical protein